MPRQRRILVVDDLRDAAESLARVLNVMGHAADFVTEPSKVLEAARAMRPDLVFLDLGMPGRQGSMPT